MKSFKEYINEGLLSAMKPKPEEDILKIDAFKRIDAVYSGDIDEKYYPTDEEIIHALDKLSDSDKIINIIDRKLNFSLLPKGDLVIDRNFYISGDVTDLPDNLTINGDFSCMWNDYLKLPENLTITGEFDCSYTTNITFPTIMEVGGGFNCEESGISELPNIIYNGELNCCDNEIRELPKNLTIHGELNCNNNYIKKLPKNLTVHGDFSCDFNFLEEFPDDLKVDGHISCEGNKTKIEKPTYIKPGQFFHN